MLRLGPPVYYWSKNNENNAYITVVFFFRNSFTLSPFFWKKCSNFIVVFCSQCPKRNRRNSLLKIREISKKSFGTIISIYFFWWFLVSNHCYFVRLFFRKNGAYNRGKLLDQQIENKWRNRIYLWKFAILPFFDFFSGMVRCQKSGGHFARTSWA